MNDMNEDMQASDPLEDELRALRTRELSDGFVESLGQRLEPSSSRVERPQPRQLGVIKLLAPLVAVAALILVALWLVGKLPVRENAAPPRNVGAELPDERFRSVAGRSLDARRDGCLDHRERERYAGFRALGP